MSTRDDVITSLTRILSCKPEIQLAYLFGSYAGEDPESAEDIDIAIYLDDAGAKSRWFRIDLAAELEKHVPARRAFDIRVLNNASIRFCFEAIHKTPRLLARDEEFAMDYETRIHLLWYDIEPTWTRFYKERSEALAR